MKNKSILLLSVLVLALIIGGASVGYKKLSKNYEATEQLASENTDKKTQAPDFTVLDSDMNKVKLSDMKGKPTVVNFWATWCRYCIVEMPHFEEAYKEYKDDINFMMVDLTDGQRETIEKAKAFIDESGYTFDIYYDTEYSAANAYRTNSIPMTVFINADGTISNIHKGAMDKKALMAYIEKLSK